MKILRLIIPFCFFLSCNAPRTVVDYDEQANFQDYNSISIYPELQTGLSELDEKRLLSSLEEVLQQKSLLATENPDLYLNVYAEQYQEPTSNSLGVGVGGTGRNVGVGISGGIPLGGPRTFLRLTFDLIDVQTNNLVWQAVVDSKFNFDATPEERQKRFNRIVQDALEEYPPKD